MPTHEPPPPLHQHGDFRHWCQSSRCVGIKPYPRPQVTLPIRIERIGGGAAPEGFAAIMWPDELHYIPLMWEDSERWSYPVEAWNKADCHRFALEAMHLVWNKRDNLVADNPFLTPFDILDIGLQLSTMIRRVDEHLLT